MVWHLALKDYNDDDLFHFYYYYYHKLKRNLGHHGVWKTFLLVSGHSVLPRAPSLDVA